ncbi:MAG: class I SAM-dependent methyltransferase [Candidatus Paceibacterota bacterium]|jgi:ubiquinone/menaquinone biosynthesis C-methylase UbiE
MKSIGPFQYRVFQKLYEKAGREMCRDCKDFIPSDSQILDVGCGSGIISKEFERFFNSEVLGIDIIDNRVLPIPFKLFRGDDLSFAKDDIYDAVLINFVLHHCKNPIELLKESKRVTKGAVILYENLPEGLLSKLFCFFHGISFAYLFQKNSNRGNFYTNKEWEKIFEDLKLEVVFSKKVSSWFNPMKEQLYVLKKGV